MFHVKHLSDTGAAESLAITSADVARCLSTVGIAVDATQSDLLRRHAEAVVDANRSFNLTTVTSSADVLRLHIADSATALPYISSSPAGVVADLGSGAGYPGIVLSILSGRDFVLVESVKKKAEFLRATVQALNCTCTVAAVRAEELAVERPAAFSAVVARAMSSLPALVELAAPLLQIGGHLICMKGRPSDEELLSGRRAAGRCGMKFVELVSFKLPDGENRAIVRYLRQGPIGERLPRRPGMAQRQPLG